MRTSIAVAVVGTAVVATFMVAPAAAATEGELRLAGTQAVPGSYLVVLKNTANVQRSVADLTERHGGTAGHVYQHVLKGFAVKASEKVARRMAADPAVDYVQQDGSLSVAETQSSPPSWGLDRVDRNVRGYNNSYEFPNGGDGVRVFVLDSGVRVTHQDFGGRAFSGKDLVDNDFDASDCTGHGTHVAGTIAGATYGVAKRAHLISVRVADCGNYAEISDVVAGIEWIRIQGVRPAVVTISLTYQYFDSTLDTAIANSIAAGITYVIAAGNGDTAGNPRNACAVSPSGVQSAIVVGSTDSLDRRAYSSNYGTCVDIFAPGEGILSTSHESDTAIKYRNGTSMAAPHVAGAAAIVLRAQPTLTPAQVRDRLVNLDPTVGAVTDPGPGSPNKLLFVRSGPLKMNLSCLTQTGSYSCQAEAIGAVGPQPYQWSTLPSSTCVVTRTVTVTVSVIDSLLASASNTRSFVCRARCGLQSIGTMCIVDPSPPAAVAGRRTEQ